MKNKKLLIYILLVIVVILFTIFIVQYFIKSNKEEAITYYSLKVDSDIFSKDDIVDIYIETNNEYGLLASKVKISNVFTISNGFNVILELKNDINEIMNKIEFISKIKITLIKSDEEYQLTNKKEIKYEEILEIIDKQVAEIN